MYTQHPEIVKILEDAGARTDAPWPGSPEAEAAEAKEEGKEDKKRKKKSRKERAEEKKQYSGWCVMPPRSALVICRPASAG